MTATQMRPAPLLPRFALMLSAPLLAAPVCKSVHPNIPTNPLPSSDFRTNQQYVEPRLVEAGANSAVVLGVADWSIATTSSSYGGLERCNLCPSNNCANATAPVTWPSAQTHQEVVGSSRWLCGFNFQNLDAYMDTHVDPYGPRTFFRNALVQLAPVFYTGKRFPPYLEGSAFDSTRFKAAYRRLWDRVWPVLQAHQSGNLVAIGLGNEVNAFIQMNPTIATWPSYTNFVQDAVNHINSTTSATSETVTMEWYGSCGIGSALWAGSTCDIQPQLDMMQIAGVQTHTYYPPTSLSDSGLTSRVGNDLAWMAYFADLDGIKALVQEAGYPASQTTTAMQGVFVSALFSYWPNYSGTVTGLNYFSVYDFPLSVFSPTGFFTASGAAKAGQNWQTFKTGMSQMQ
jgi:hypothetical protein